MKIGVPKEILNSENRVAITPSWSRTLHEAGHEVFIEAGAGVGSSFHDDAYMKSGAVVLDSAEEVFRTSDIILKVKQPLEQEYKLIEERHILFTYLHLASSETLTKALQDTGAHCIAYETIEDRDGRLPLLKPMSEVAGRMSVQIGARFLERGIKDQHPGRGILLGGASGVPQANVTILGAGIVGRAALKIAVGMGAYVNVVDNNLNALSQIDDLYGSRVTTVFSTSSAIEQKALQSDLVIGGVLITGKKAPKLINEDMVRQMKYGSVIIDVAVDQGGCIETSEVTSHENPVVVKHDVLHYGVANMPGAVPNTSTHALCNSTMPYLMKLATRGIDALDEDPGFKKGLNISKGKLLIDI
ncbi:MAG: alanine dehydrogenase [Candidatus Caenarcaniphilales bacterium]|nr:alanine dehydrogenase [Candidatus Caenarcaniphilales bacterium]